MATYTVSQLRDQGVSESLISTYVAQGWAEDDTVSESSPTETPFTPDPEASAPVQQNIGNPADDPDNYFAVSENTYQKITPPNQGALYDVTGNYLGNPAQADKNMITVDPEAIHAEAQASAAEAKLAEGNEKGTTVAATKTSKKPVSRNRFDQNVQKLLLDRIGDVYKHAFWKLDKEGQSGTANVNIRKLSPQINAGSYTSVIGMGGSASDNGKKRLKDYGAFVHATPAQLSHLLPLLRFFMVDEKGFQKEITFGDYTSEAVIKHLAQLRSTGTIKETLGKRSLRGSTAGIKSFSWNYFNRHEGDKIIEAQLQVYFGSLTELTNNEYLELVFMNGLRNEHAKPISDAEGNVANDADASVPRTNADILKSLMRDKEKYADLFRRKKLPTNLLTLTKSSGRREYRHLRVLVGWSLPEGSKASLRKSFDTPEQYHNFIEGVRASIRVITLQLTNYNVDFAQDGTCSLTIDYVGSTDNYLASNGSDIFGFFSSAGNKMFKNTVNVPLSTLPTENTKDVIRAKSSVYLRNIGLTGAEFIKDANDQEVIPVTLEGLMAAEAYNGIEQKIAELEGKSVTGATWRVLKKRESVLQALREQATLRSLGDIYANFIQQMFENGTDIFKARVLYKKIANVRVPYIEWDGMVIAEADVKARMERQLILRQRREILASASSAARTSIEPADVLEPLPDSDNLDFYYMRLGDIIKTAMITAGFRDEIAIVLGNAEQAQGSFSLYDVPITLGTFGQFFYNNVVQPQVRLYPFRRFVEQLLELAATLLNKSAVTASRIALDQTMVISETTVPSPFELGEKDLNKIADGQSTYSYFVKDDMGFGSNLAVPLTYYYVIFSQSPGSKKRTAQKTKDEEEGVYHYVIGSDKGLVKTYNFSRQDTKYFQEMLIESENAQDQIAALFLPQNVTLKMVGNSLHRNGDMIYIDSRPALGSYAGPVLGIGGYYRVVKIRNKISTTGFETEMECVFVLRASTGKAVVD
jgi:hypothetical protein